MQPEYDFSKGERGKFYYTDTVDLLHIKAIPPHIVLLTPKKCAFTAIYSLKPYCEVSLVLHIPICLDNWSEAEWLHAAAHNPAFDFLKDAAEDIYSPTDGEPFRDAA